VLNDIVEYHVRYASASTGWITEVIDPQGFDITKCWGQSSTHTGSYVREIYTLNLTVLEHKLGAWNESNAIDFADVKIVDNTGNEYTNFTDFDGFCSTELEVARCVMNTTSGTITRYNPFTLVVSKDGYETYRCKFNLTGKKDMIIRLRNDISGGRDAMGEEWR
jgi:hypothetical protein